MFKRANKITALLVAAASIMSVVPAMASERLGTKEGTISNGISFDGGKYIYDGYRTDADDTGIYYNGGDADKLVEDLEDIDGITKYGTKYIFASESNTDQYLVDLSTGKVIDDETDEEKRDSVQAKLRSTLKKTDRYALTTEFDDVAVGSRLFQGNYQFGDVWYMYSAKADGNYSAGTTKAAVQPTATITLPASTAALQTLREAGDIKLFGNTIPVAEGELLSSFVTKVDAIAATQIADLATAGITATYTDGVIKVTDIDGVAVTANVSNANYAKIKAVLNGESTLKVTFDQGYKGISTNDFRTYQGFVNQDGKYVDASNLGNIYVYSKAADKVVKVEEYSNYDKDNKVMVQLENIKPIAQDKDYIYAITEVNIYQGPDADNCTQNSNDSARTAYFYQKIAKAQGDKKDDAYIPKTVDSFEIDNKSFYDDGDSETAYKILINASDDGYDLDDNMYTVKDGTLYVVRVKSDKIKVFKMKTKKAKVSATDAAVAAGKVVTDKKFDAPLLQKDADGDHDLFKDSYGNAVSIDVDGNIWALDQGSIYKVDGTTFNEVYTLDRSINNLDVYNEGSLIAWEHSSTDDGEVYTTVTEGKAVTTTEAETVVTPAKVGWDQLADGSWNFYDATGAKVVNNWANVGGVWYYLKAEGVMATGWENVGGTWYYLAPSGAMKTGWVNDNGTWYYLASSGAMKTGWVNDNGTWYYLNGSGAMLANTTVDGYVLNASGAWVK